ncbi:hypothetical protein QQ045_004274 [Rhodiola kirilowii]
MAWKIDLRKAYDTVNWSFLRSMLGYLTFPMKFISWISMCVESTCFLIQINGELVDFFDGETRLAPRRSYLPFAVYDCYGISFSTAERFIEEPGLLPPPEVSQSGPQTDYVCG